MSTIILTQPAASPGPGIPGTSITGVAIPPLTTVSVDSITALSNLSVKWIYTLIDSTSENVLTAEVVANHQFENEVRWNRYGLVGDMMSHIVTVDLTGSPSNMELNITNNHPTNTFTVNIVRIQMLS